MKRVRIEALERAGKKGKYFGTATDNPELNDGTFIKQGRAR